MDNSPKGGYFGLNPSEVRGNSLFADLELKETSDNEKSPKSFDQSVKSMSSFDFLKQAEENSNGNSSSFNFMALPNPNENAPQNSDAASTRKDNEDDSTSDLAQKCLSISNVKFEKVAKPNKNVSKRKKSALKIGYARDAVPQDAYIPTHTAPPSYHVPPKLYEPDESNLNNDSYDPSIHQIMSYMENHTTYSPEIPARIYSDTKEAENVSELSDSIHNSYNKAPSECSSQSFKLNSISSINYPVKTLSSSSSFKSNKDVEATPGRKSSSFSIFDKMLGFLSSNTQAPPPPLVPPANIPSANNTVADQCGKIKDDEKIENVRKKESENITVVASPPPLNLIKHNSNQISKEIEDKTDEIGQNSELRHGYETNEPLTKFKKEVIKLGKFLDDLTKRKIEIQNEELGFELKISILNKRIAQDELKQSEFVEKEEYEEADALNSSIEKTKNELTEVENQFQKLEKRRVENENEIKETKQSLLDFLDNAGEDLSEKVQREADEEVISMKKDVFRRLEKEFERLEEEDERIKMAQKNLELDIVRVKEESERVNTSILSNAETFEKHKKEIFFRKSGAETEIAELYKKIKAKKAELAGITEELNQIEQEAESDRARQNRLLSRIEERKRLIEAEAKDYNLESEKIKLAKEKLTESNSQAKADIRRQLQISKDRKNQISIANLVKKLLGSVWDKKNSVECAESTNEAHEFLKIEIMSLEVEENSLIDRISQYKAELKACDKEKAELEASMKPLEEAKKSSVEKRDFKKAASISNQIKASTSALSKIRDKTSRLDISPLKEELICLREEKDRKKDEYSRIARASESKKMACFKAQILKLQRGKRKIQNKIENGSETEWAEKLVEAEINVLEKRARDIGDGINLKLEEIEADSDDSGSCSGKSICSEMSTNSNFFERTKASDESSGEKVASRSSEGSLDDGAVFQTETIAEIERKIEIAVENEDFELAAELDAKLQVMQENISSWESHSSNAMGDIPTENENNSNHSLNVRESMLSNSVRSDVSRSVPEQNVPRPSTEGSNPDLPEIQGSSNLESEPEATRNGNDPEADIHEEDYHSEDYDSVSGRVMIRQSLPEMAEGTPAINDEPESRQLHDPEAHRGSSNASLSESDGEVLNGDRSPEAQTSFHFLSVEDGNERNQRMPSESYPEGFNERTRDDEVEIEPDDESQANIDADNEIRPPESIPQSNQEHGVSLDPEQESRFATQTTQVGEEGVEESKELSNGEYEQQIVTSGAEGGQTFTSDSTNHQTT